MKKILFTTIAIIFATASFAQKVKISKNKITVDGTHILNYEKSSGFSFSIFDLNDNEIMFFKLHNNETQGYTEDDYYILQFFEENKKIETTERGWISVAFSAKAIARKYIKWLIKERVMDKSGKINAEKLDRFAKKYEENITNRTVRN